MHHNTYSLQNILNQPIDPNLCKRILQQIKSPLMQQSFAMTNDESLSQSWINPPKRPNIPPPSQQNVQQSRRPNIKSKYGGSYGNDGFLNNFNNNNNNHQHTESFYEVEQHPYTENRNFLQNITQRYDSQVVEFNKHTFDINSGRGFLSNGENNFNTNFGYNTNRNINNNNNNNVESIVSPLDPNITMKKKAQQQQQNSFPIIDNKWSQFCGGLFNTGKQVQHQLYYEQQQQQQGRSKSHQRKKIFDSKAQSLLQSTKKNYLLQRENKKQKNHNRIQSILLIKEEESHIEVDHSSINKKGLHLQHQTQQKTLKKVLSQLKSNHHQQMSNFIQLICTTIDLLIRAQTDKQFILENIQVLTQLSSAQQNDLSGLIIGEERYNKFLNRMNFVSLTDMLRKLSKTKLIKQKNIDAKQYQRLKNKVSQSLQNMLLNYSQIQKMLEEFVNKKDSIQSLKKVYNLLMQKFYYQKQTKSTLEQLQMVMADVRLFKYENEVGRLEYVWEALGEKVLSEEEFVGCVVRGSGVYGRVREGYSSKLQPNNESILAESRNRLQSQLSKMGFVRN